MKVKQVKTGDIIKALEGVRLVVQVLEEDTHKILVRPLWATRDDAYLTARPSAPFAWVLLARGAERYTPGMEYVR